MKVIVIKGDKRVEVEIPDEQFEKLFAGKKTGYERAERNAPYYHVDSFGDAVVGIETFHEYDDGIFRASNYFSDENVAENMARAQRLWNQIHRRAVELCEPAKISDVGAYASITYRTMSCDIVAENWGLSRLFGAIWFDTKEHCEQVIDEFRDELMWYFTEFKDRADT